MILALLLALATSSAPADTVREREIVVPGPVPLPGTLTLPAGTGPFPGVVIVHGSGPGDRDLTLGPNKPYRDIAHGLAARGGAVLRYDKRTRVRPGWFLNKSFTLRDETIDDAVSAVALLRAMPEVDPARVFVIGHSLGGLAAPRIAAADGKLAGMILMAGGWVTPLLDLLLVQLDYAATVAPTPAESLAIVQQRAIAAPMVAYVGRLTRADSASTSPVLGAPASYWLDLLAHDGATDLAARPEPVLLLQGERDYQITPAEFEAFVVRLGDRPMTRAIRYPALNHLFIAGTGAPRPAEYGIPGTVAVQVIDDIAAWIGTTAPRVAAP